MTEIHNAELAQDIITGAVAAWLEQTNDSAMSIDVGFERDASHTSNFDLIATAKIEILKADDFRPMTRGEHFWLDEDQKDIENLPAGTRRAEAARTEQEKKEKGVAETLWGYYKKWTKRAPTDAKRRDSPMESPVASPGFKKWAQEPVKKIAVKREIPSAEFYPVKFVESARRTLNRRKSYTELDTAHEAPAVREKGEANDRTDQDCRTLPTDLASSKESLATEAPTQKGSPASSPPNKEEETIKPIPEKEPEPVKKVETVVTKKRSRTRMMLNVKRRPDSGDLQIVSEKDGIVTFTCSTKHRVKKTSKRN
ncbi:unnamed protein product [Caenorhabditis sp. 36 PRJEB53466]|nr:unnamed protein product [Caenorhabditis sp. 36 PRJEB53466]